MRHLRDYQKKALDYCLSRHNPALFMQMRLGKTLVAIRWSRRMQFKKILVVAPSSALFSWEDELKLEGERNFVYLMGSRQQREEILRTSSAKWFLLNKEGFFAFKLSPRKFNPLFTEYPFDAIILDESTFIRRPTSQVSKFYTRHLQQIPYRMIMSGMPNPEGLEDFFQQFLFLDGGTSFGSNFYLWKKKWFRPQGPYFYGPRAQTSRFVKSVVRENAFVVRRKHVKLDRPIVHERRFAVLPDKLRKAYDKAEQEFILEYDGKEVDRTVYKIAAYAWLRHLASGFLDGELIWSGKFDLVFELLEEELRGEPMILWFDYNEGLFAMRRLLLQRGYKVRTVVGRPHMSFARRRISIRDWKNGKAQILIGQPRCLQFGVDLSRAQQEIFFTTPLSNEIRTQAMERILKASKKKQNPLLCVDLITRNTVDVDTYRQLVEKKATAVRLLDACRAIKERRS